MKAKKSIPTLLLFALLSMALAGCGDSTTANAPAGTTTQPTSNVSRSASGSNSNPTPNTSAANRPATSRAGAADLKLTVVKYAFVSDGLLSYYIGVVRNDGSTDVKQAIMRLADDSGKPLSTDDAPETLLPQVFTLPLGQSVGFSIMYEGKPIQHPQFSFEQQPDDTNLASVKLTIVSSQRGTASDGNPDIEGDIRNDSDTSANLWSINAVAYGDAGNVVAVGSGGAADPTQGLKGHATIKFSVTLSPRNAKIAKFDLFASGVTMGLN